MITPFTTIKTTGRWLELQLLRKAIPLKIHREQFPPEHRFKAAGAPGCARGTEGEISMVMVIFMVAQQERMCRKHMKNIKHIT